MLVLILAIVATVLAALDLLLWNTVEGYRTHVPLQIAGVLLGISVILIATNVSSTV